jgi:hypothetical protein
VRPRLHLRLEKAVGPAAGTVDRQNAPPEIIPAIVAARNNWCRVSEPGNRTKGAEPQTLPRTAAWNIDRLIARSDAPLGGFRHVRRHDQKAAAAISPAHTVRNTFEPVSQNT